ncbi:MAG: tetratricopeptide repeat protein, partial [Burkholderiales bacterium]|nr:tetratricopeptide repeat protein [Anaerolineae bacterium]
EAALVYWTPQSAPLDYARTQYNLGAIYRDLSQITEREGNLRRAVAAYEAALVYQTGQSTPLDYAMTQCNLGIVQAVLGDIELAINCWCAAAKYYRQMGYRDDAEKMLQLVAEAGGAC